MNNCGEPPNGQEDWKVAYQFMDRYIGLLEKLYGGDDYLAVTLREDLGKPEDFRKRWEGFSKEQKSSLIEKARLGADAVLDQYRKSPEAQAINEEREKAARKEPFDTATVKKVQLLLVEVGADLEGL